MKKFLIIISLIIITFGYTKGEEIVIPDEAIRFRVVAKSNSKEDQKLKVKVKDIKDVVKKNDATVLYEVLDEYYIQQD